MKLDINRLPIIAMLLLACFSILYVKPSQAANEDIVKAKVEEIDVKEESEESLTAKVKVQLIDGTYAGTSLFTDYEGDVKLRVDDEIFVRQTISENELQKVEYAGFNRTMYLMWLCIAAAIILISIIAISAPKELIPATLLGIVVFGKLFNFAFANTNHYFGALIIISLIVIITNIVQKGLDMLNIIATISGIAGIALTMVLQVFFSNAMRIPTTDRSLFDVGVVIAASGIIFYNAQRIVFELKDSLKTQEISNRNHILKEGLEISRKYSSFAITILFWAFIGLMFPTIYLKLEGESTSIGFFNDPQIAQVASAILSSVIGVLIVPVTTTILSFFIIDINNLGRRVPKKKQMEMNV